MSNSQHLNAILDRAKGKEKKYDWAKAAKLYDQASRMIEKTDFLRRGEIQEKVGYAFYRTARQAESANQFRKMMRQAVADYEKARELFGRLGEPGKTPRMLRCDAMTAYMDYWLASEVPEKKRLLDKCWQLTKEALKAFEEANDAWEYGKTYNQLSTSVLAGFFLDWNVQSRQKKTTAAIEHGEKAIEFLSTSGKPFELARACVKTATHLQMSGYYFLNLDQRQRRYQKAASYWQKANELSEETAMIELLNSGGMAKLESDWGWGSSEAITNFKRALEYGSKTRDRFIAGTALSWLAFSVSLKLGERILDPDEGIRLLNIALGHAEEAKRQFAPISFISPLYGALWVEAPLAEYYRDLATWEVSLTKRHRLLDKAKQTASDMLRRAKNSGYPEVIMFAHMESSVILFSLAVIEPNSVEKKPLLERALEHRNEAVRINEQFIPFFFWYRGFNQNYLAGIKFEIASLAKDTESKKNMLKEAIRDKETSLKLCIAHTTFWERQGELPPLLSALGAWQYGYGNLLTRLYEVTNNSEHLKEAIGALEDATESFGKLDLPHRIAECYWKAAQIHDTLGEHLEASRNFDLSSNTYKRAAEKIPQLRDFYEEHAFYMQAWSEIEKARRCHKRQEYDSAREHFEKAAGIHRTSERWGYLAQHYSACAQVDHAEELSRKEKSEEALNGFEHATRLFNETKKSLQAKHSKIESPDEKQMAASMLKTIDLRVEYCNGRIALEEAKILDRQGDHAASSRKYSSAVERFQKAMDATANEADRQELRPIVDLCRAWQLMTRAEAEASPDLYLEASHLFDEAKEHSFSEEARTLALGHSCFCKALEAGTRFEASRDMAVYSTARKYMEAATDYYLKAGFRNAAEYAKATYRLFDAYMYSHKAQERTDPEKRAQLYQMAERLLQASAGSYTKAKHPAKAEGIQRLLESVREERQLATSLAEVFHAPEITSTTTSFAIPNPTHEQAVGLEGFEHATIQANLILRVKEVKVGDDLEFRVELVNAGKAPALLVKVDRLVPAGFEVKEVPETYRVEDSFLNMKGKKLNPLKTEDVKIVINPRAKGTFIVKPQVLYIDETGQYKSHEPQPVTITVKELGIKGWIKGER